MVEWMHDDDVLRGLRASTFQKKTLSDCVNFIKNSYEMKNDCHMAIVDEKDEYIGTVSLKDIDVEYKDAEFAIVLRKSAWGRGYAKQAIEDIIQVAFVEYGLKSIYCNVLRDNVTAISLYEKVGWVRIDEVSSRYIERAPRNEDGSVMDIVFYRCVK